MLNVLIVDDSLVFRRFLGELFEGCANIAVVGEAGNGIEALKLLLTLKPDVILLDLEMPLMDGMTVLQHFMIHRPTPTIMFSSLTEEGTARCYDTLKNGAVDFICKDFIFQRSGLDARRQLLVEKVEKAGRMVRLTRDPFATGALDKEPPPPSNRMRQWAVFCEECGHRENVTLDMGRKEQSFTCSACGDTIVHTLSTADALPRERYVSFLVGGIGSPGNLLSILPYLETGFTGSIIGLFEVDQNDHLKNLAEYLDAISTVRVVRAEDGMTVDSGTCYLLSTDDNMVFVSDFTEPMLQKNSAMEGVSPLDILLRSAAATFSKNTSAYFLSGRQTPTDAGLVAFATSPDRIKLLLPDESLFRGLTRGVVDTLSSAFEPEQLSTAQIAGRLSSLHRPPADF